MEVRLILQLRWHLLDFLLSSSPLPGKPDRARALHRRGTLRYRFHYKQSGCSGDFLHAYGIRRPYSDERLLQAGHSLRWSPKKVGEVTAMGWPKDAKYLRS